MRVWARVRALATLAVVYELAMWRSLGRWVARRPDVPPGAAPFAYVGAVDALLWGFIGVSAVELVAVHLLLPWEAVRLVADVLGVWGLVWMLGLRASMVVRPHVATPAGLRLRTGVTREIDVPWSVVAGATVRERSRDSGRSVQVDVTDRGTTGHLVGGSRTNVDLALREPYVLRHRRGATAVDALRLYADDPRGLVREVRGHLADRADPLPAPPGPDVRPGRRPPRGT